MKEKFPVLGIEANDIRKHRIDGELGANCRAFLLVRRVDFFLETGLAINLS